MAAKASPTQHFLELPDGSKFVYLDSGASPTYQPYTTFIFLHGALFNHLIWSRMLTCIPPNTRIVAPSTRGYKPSSPFEDESKEETRALLGHDLASMITEFASHLSLLSHPESKVKLLIWSMGICSLLSAYHLLAEDKLLIEEEDKALSENVSEIIIFEPPASLGLGLEPSAFTTAYRQSVIGKSPEDMFTISMAQVTGFYDFSDQVISYVEKGIRDEDTLYKWRKASFQDPWFGQTVLPTIDPTPISKYLEAATPENEQGQEYARDAMRAMLKSPGIKGIKVLSTKHTVADCLEGVAELVGEFAAMAKVMEIENKMKLEWMEGEYNHFVHIHAPKVLWAALV